MGKQSARLIYRGKDHKDIYFQGHYHDAMYLGYELLWHKIRQEGYYVFIVDNGKEGRFQEGIYIITFDEKTQEFEIVMEIKDTPDSFTENFFGGAYMVDSERMYICSLSWDDTIWASIDGIHYKKTNLVIKNQVDYRPFFSRSYHSYSLKNDNGFSYKVNYTWWYTGELGGNFYIWKFIITKNADQYTVEQKRIDTGLKYSSASPSYDAHYGLLVPKYGDSRFALHQEEYTWESEKIEYKKVTISYYDTQEETSGKIAEFEFERNSNVGTGNFFHVNGVYIFFVYDFYNKQYVEQKQKLFVYYSFDGITYENSLIYNKIIPQSDRVSEFPRIWLVLYRKGMYYLYGSGEVNEYYEPPYTVYLTTDFKHFQKKRIPREIKIGEKRFNTLKLIDAESKMLNHSRRYFYDGEVSDPEDGISTIYDEKLIYIDNMFFRESSGNKVFEYQED